MKMKSKTKRAVKRFSSCLVIKFNYKRSTFYGLATNVSEKGMCISAGINLPDNWETNLLIPIKNNQLEISSKVKWTKQTNGFYDSMGVEIFNPPEKYFQIVDSFKSAV
jgi:hypothetical protein